jgi:hypothetical protein
LEILNLPALHNRRRHFDASILTNAFVGTKFCPAVPETVAFEFPLGTSVTLPRSLALLATALQRDVSTDVSGALVVCVTCLN